MPGACIAFYPQNDLRNQLSISEFLAMKIIFVEKEELYVLKKFDLKFLDRTKESENLRIKILINYDQRDI